jgi:N-methylhydantoinase A/oxoprolinase/acetone carboxylase beta subunit
MLGIDTGGTFTDSVLLDPAERAIVATSKAPTTHARLLDGIVDSIGGLAIARPEKITLVGLSTTLATNAIVEGKNRPVGLLIIGYENDLSVPIPAVRTRRVAGGHTVRGAEAAALDERAIRHFVETINEEVEAYACASYFSVRNPRHEDRAEAIIKKLTDKPVVLGHKLSMELDAEVRATTAALNAGLIPLVEELLDAVGAALGRLSIAAPLMVVRGDGSLMNEPTARSRPIETILSGPAASVVGARALAPAPDGADAVVIDIGGTTTDIAHLCAGLPRRSSVGARVGAWRTFVGAVDIRTMGLGGDSLIDYADGRAISVGPTRVLPIGRLALDHRSVAAALERIAGIAQEKRREVPTDFWAAARPLPDGAFGEEERRLFERIVDTPLSGAETTDLRERLRLERALDRLTRAGAVVRAGLTPTDLFNAAGLSSVGDPDASALALSAAARCIGVPPDEFARRVLSVIGERLMFEVIGASLGTAGEGAISDFGILARPVTDWLSARSDGRGVSLDIRLKDRIVGVGAPVGLFVRPVAQRLGAECVVPEDAAVAGAVGAVSGAVTAFREATVRSFGDGAFVLFSPVGRTTFRKLAEAKAAAVDELSALVREEIERGPDVAAELAADWEEHWGGEGENRILIEARLTLRAVGRPAAVPG